MDLDMEQLLKALDNDQNEYLLHLNTQKIKQMKYDILRELDLEPELFNEIMTKLKEYKYCDEINDFRQGSHIRWIPLKDPENVHLSTPCMFCETKIEDSGVVIICKNFARKHYHLKMDECMFFQKLANQELVMLSALDYLSKK